MARYWLKADCPRKAYKIRTADKPGLPKPLTLRRLRAIGPEEEKLGMTQVASVEVPPKVLEKLTDTFVGPFLVEDTPRRHRRGAEDRSEDDRPETKPK